MNTFALFDRGAGARTKASALLVVVLATAGCSILRAAPDASRYFVLSSTDGVAAEGPGRKRSDVYFGLGPVKLPGYLGVQTLVRTGSNGSVEYVPNAFWAEPVSDGFARALLYRTGARIGTNHGIAFPWYSTTRVDWKVPVDVLRFEATNDGRAVLVVRWSVERTSDRVVVAGGESVFEETAGADPALMVDALSRCIDRLAETLAAAVTGPTAVAAPAPKAAAKRKGATPAPAPSVSPAPSASPAPISPPSPAATAK